MSTLETHASLRELEERIGHVFDDGQLVRTALTHRSFAAEAERELPDYQRLEFLGDAVIQLVVSHELFMRFPEADEGSMSRTRSQLVSREALAEVARAIDLGEFILLGKGAEQQGGRNQSRILADVVEALVGAVYLDRGECASSSVVRNLLQPRLDALTLCERAPDYKSRLQEQCQRRYRKKPSYEIVGQSGPPHRRIFVIEARIDQRLLGSGEGRSKQQAEQAAAQSALRTVDAAAN